MAETDQILKDTVIIIPTKRATPLRTLQLLLQQNISLPIIIQSDPRTLEANKTIANSQIRVVEGKVGMIPQSLECYRQAFKAGFRFYFRLDDDWHANMFVNKQGPIPWIEAITEARKCAEALGTSLNGFQNTARKDWLGTGFKRTFGLITGGAQLCAACEDPSFFLDENLPAYEDVYRSAAHREKDGCLGRVAAIGVDKREALRDSSMNKSKEVQEEAKRIILSRFPDTVTCNGYRTLDGGLQTIPNWRLVRGPKWRW